MDINVSVEPTDAPARLTIVGGRQEILAILHAVLGESQPNGGHPAPKPPSSRPAQREAFRSVYPGADVQPLTPTVRLWLRRDPYQRPVSAGTLASPASTEFSFYLLRRSASKRWTYRALWRRCLRSWRRGALSEWKT